MEIDRELVGRYVALQFARPVYVFVYGAHVPGESGEQAMPCSTSEPIPLTQEQATKLEAMRRAGQDVPAPRRPIMRDMMIGKLVDVFPTDETIVIEIVVPREDNKTFDLMRKHIDTGNILACDIVQEVDIDMPAAFIKERTRHGGSVSEPTATGEGKIIL